MFVLIANDVRRGVAEPPPMWLFVPPIVFWGWFWYLMIRTPFELKIRQDQSVEFRSLFKRIVLAPQLIKSIKAPALVVGWVCVRHDSGKISMVNHFDGFYDFIWTLKSINPAIKVKGC